MERLLSSWTRGATFVAVAAFGFFTLLAMAGRPAGADEPAAGQAAAADDDLEQLAGELDAAGGEAACEEEAEVTTVDLADMQDYEARRKQQAIEQRERLTKDPKWQPSHEQVARIEIASGLSNFCLDSKGRILACCNDSKIRVYSQKGKLVETWDLDFAAQAIGVSKKSGVIFAGGSGQIAKLAADGRVLKTLQFPRGMTDEELEAAVQAQVASQKKMYEDYLKGLKSQLAEAEKLVAAEKKEDGEAEQAQVDYECIAGMSSSDAGIQVQFKEGTSPKAQVAVLKMYVDSISQQFEGPQQLEESIRQQMKMSSQTSSYTGVAVADTDLFVVCSAPGYSYNAWRMTHELEDAKVIVSGLRGCCGQMDCQTHNGDLWVPVNAEHKVYQYDRDGTVLNSFGTYDRESAEGFGGCCEPKNMRIGQDGFAYCAESGPPVCVKRFSLDGEFQNVVCFPLYDTGCVRVTVDMAKDKVFLLSPNEGAVYVFAPKQEG